MARIVTVHGTFAHLDTSNQDGGVAGPQPLSWWQAGSAFETDLEELVTADDGSIDVHPFVWSGQNSERERRKAALQLFEVVSELEDRGEPYCLVGHSHGGSVISSMLVRAASHNIELPHLRRWITVGTPFLELRKEHFLFSRLPLLLKAIFVASLMLLVMFLVSTAAEYLDGHSPFATNSTTAEFLSSLVLTAMPFVLFYLTSTWHQRRALFFYRPKNIARARATFTDRWLPLNHGDDEVITALGSLGSVKLKVFEENFAVSSLSVMSVFVLPLMYLALLNSPAAMVGIADVLKNRLYGVRDYERVETTYVEDQKAIRKIRNRIRDAQNKSRDPAGDVASRSDGRTDYSVLTKELKDMKRKIRVSYPDLQQTERAHRFKVRFLIENGQDCANHQLCQGGRSLRLNSQLLFHLVTDEVARVIVNDNLPGQTVTGVLRFVLPILLVPVVFGLLAITLVLLVQALARIVSRVASRRLDALTWSQVRRTVLGNDTEAEVAIAAHLKPVWIEQSRAFLPDSVGDEITAYSNAVTADSLSKFRNAISELAFADRSGIDQDSALSYLTWRELVHASYFEVPVFLKLVALAVAQQPGFKATEMLSGDAQLSMLTEIIAATNPGATDPATEQNRKQ